jgi:5-hydroxyisourate hydrolase/2-oxo-4-hydroxy-4-carboxy-5-ureidoimidazoline decarboxylase
MDFEQFNKQGANEASSLLSQTCGAEKWVNKMLEHFPFANPEALIDAATTHWYKSCNEADWKEAFTHHPRIGDLEQLEKKFASTKSFTKNEQSGVSENDKETISQLLKANEAYEKKFGYIFIVHASGKTGAEMLNLLNDRLVNKESDEIQIAMGEQHKITITRLKKLLDQEDWSFLKASQLTTHVLDTSIGQPGRDISIKLLSVHLEKWRSMAQGRTNADGRIADLLPPGRNLDAGVYKLIFDTGGYFEKKGLKNFFPRVSIQFIISDNEHYHVPLLLNPFGYSTYRGS